jgi:SAM-dependent methyltransferase
MIAEYLKLNMPLKDTEVDLLYPVQVRGLSERHFTPIAVAIKAAELLVTKPKQKVLDIGCGVGKFCFVAGSYTDASFTGIDYRKHFIETCNKLTAKHRFKNVNFIHADITDVNLRSFNNFYFFNSFLEHTDSTAKVDNSIETSEENYKKYSGFLRDEFEKLPEGTRIVTYHGRPNQIPNSYQIIGSYFGTALKCWEKTSNPIGKLL